MTNGERGKVVVGAWTQVSTRMGQGSKLGKREMWTVGWGRGMDARRWKWSKKCWGLWKGR